MNIAIAHDQFRTMGGAERVAVAMARAFDCPIYAMRVDDDVPPDDVEVINLSDRIGEFLMHRHYLIQDAYQMLAWQHVEALYQYDIVIENKTNPYWFVPHSDSQTIIRYVHSTPRGMYDLFRYHGGAALTDSIKTVQRLLYQQTAPYADAWLCNSDIVARRVQTYFAPTAETDVIYPPVETTRTTPATAPTQEYYFSVGRLASNKRIGLLRDIAEATDKHIVVAGDGPYRDELLQDKPPNLEYVGYVSAEEKYRRLSEAQAFLMLAEHEDFGITPIESFAAGTPVIGVNEGFTQYQVKDGLNGYRCKPTVKSVAASIDRFESGGVDWSADTIAEFAEQFSTDRFKDEIQAQVTRIHEASTVEPNFTVPDHD